LRSDIAKFSVGVTWFLLVFVEKQGLVYYLLYTACASLGILCGDVPDITWDVLLSKLKFCSLPRTAAVFLELSAEEC
jgi:hypothetical protein